MADPLREPSLTPSQRPTSLDDEHLSGDQSRVGALLPQVELMPYGPSSMGLAYSTRVSSDAETQRHHLQSFRTGENLVAPPLRPTVPLRRCRVNMTVICGHRRHPTRRFCTFLSGEPLVENMDSVPMFEFHSEAQLHITNMDYIKWAIQDLCWQCFGSPSEKGTFVPMNFSSLWSEVLNSKQIPYGQERIDLRAHHPEGIFD